MKKIVILILLFSFTIFTCSSPEKKPTPPPKEETPIENVKGPSPKKFSVSSEDNIELDFDLVIKPEDLTMVPPSANLNMKLPNGEEGDLLVAFGIVDPSSNEISEALAKLKAENNTQDISINFTFSNTDLTYMDVLDNLEQHKINSEDPFMEKVVTNVRISVGGNSILNKSFIGGIIPLEFGNFPVYVFDCHSVWSLYDFKTLCRVFKDCIQCLTFVWFDGEWETQQSGWHHCYCLD